MSPLWRDEVRVVLSPDRVVLARRKRGVRPQVSAQVEVPCGQPAGAEPWRLPLVALTEVLQEPQWRNANAVVILSSQFVRYVLVPWSDKLDSADEEIALARHCFSRIHGEVAEQWTIRLSKERAGASRVASAVDSLLMSELNTLFTASSLRLASIQPALMAAFNDSRRQMRGSSFWFVTAESGKLCVALISAGRWLVIRTRHTDGSWLAALDTILSREERLADAESIALTQSGPIPVYLHGEGLADHALPESQKWDWRLLSPESLTPCTPVITAAEAS